MGRAAVEPDVENVGDHLVIVRVAIRTEKFRGAAFFPCIDRFGGDSGLDAVVDFRIDQQLAGFAVDEQRERARPRRAGG